MTKRIKWKNIVITIILIICLVTFGISTFNIIKWKIDSDNTNKQIEKIENITKVEEIKNSENAEIIEQIEEVPKSNPYWDYIEMNLINVNFDEIKNINEKVAGWIQVNGTNINYPFVHTNNNDFYLTHSFDDSYNSAGWVFLDYRNNKNLSSKNNIIYAHGRFDRTMFGSLKNILESGWLNNSNNYVVKLSTESENTLWQVFSVYHIPTTNDYIQVDFSSDEQFLEFSNMLLNRSAYNFNTTINENDKILTLSTCYNDQEKVVLHAKLIKKEAR